MAEQLIQLHILLDSAPDLLNGDSVRSSNHTALREIAMKEALLHLADNPPHITDLRTEPFDGYPDYGRFVLDIKTSIATGVKQTIDAAVDVMNAPEYLQ